MSPFHWLFEDRTSGRVVVVQKPNLTLWVFLAALAATYLVPAGRPVTIARIVELVALALWALDEVSRGVNPWRRPTGAGTLIGLVAWLIMSR